MGSACCCITVDKPKKSRPTMVKRIFLSATHMIATACRAVRAPAVSHCLLRQPRCGFKIYTRTGDEGSSSEEDDDEDSSAEEEDDAREA